MIINVSISQFRQNIAEYISKARNGYTVILEDEKKGEKIGELTGKKKFNPITFGQALTAASGLFTAKNHPEWKTKQDVLNWVQDSRQSSDRNF